MAKRKYWTGTKRAPAQDRFFIDALDPDLWSRGNETDWDALWQTGMPPRSVFKSMRPGQWINHIPGNHALTVKSRLHQTLNAARRRAPAELQNRFGFFPDSYLMPADYHVLQKEAFAHPQKRWIIKPKSLSRGRGIEVIADAGAAPVDEKMLVQEYLDRPHLFDGRKYVLRCYLAIMSVEPLRVYLYKEGFVKLASEPYRDGDFDNLYAHLTNPDVNALNEAVDASVVFYSFAEYREWLRGHGADPAPIFDGLRDIGAIAAIAAREAMRARLAASGAWGPGCCELIGMDCMIDADLKPWLLECNLSPSLGICAAPGSGGEMEERTKRAVVADLVAMAGLNDPDKDIIEPGDVSAVIAASEKESERAAGFERIFPTSDAASYFPFFPAPRHADIELAEAAGALTSKACRYAANRVSEFVFDDELALQGADGAGMTPTTAGAYIWLRASVGDAPEDIARDLSQSAGGAPRETLKAVRESLADWGAAGLLLQDGTTPANGNEQPPAAARDCSKEMAIHFAGRDYRIQIAGPEIEQRIGPVIAPLRTDNEQSHIVSTISILRGDAGYAITEGARLVSAGLRLSQIAGALCEILKNEIAADAPILAASLWRITEKTLLIASSAKTRWDCLGAAAMKNSDADLIAGVCAFSKMPGGVAPLLLPARAKIEDADVTSLRIDQWPGEARGTFLATNAKPLTEYSVDAVILPDHQPTETAAVLKQISGRSAFLAIAKLVDDKGGLAASQLAHWAAHIPCFEVRFCEPNDGARALMTLTGE